MTLKISNAHEGKCETCGCLVLLLRGSAVCVRCKGKATYEREVYDDKRYNAVKSVLGRVPYTVL